MDANEVATSAWALRVNLMRVAVSILRHNADAEDAVSMAMLNAYRSAGGLHDADKLNAWIMRILVRCCYDVLRQRKREGAVEDLEAVEPPVLEGSEGSVFESIQQLAEPYRRILVLFYYEGFKAREIAHILSIPLGTVLVQLSRGRAKLKEILEKEGVVHGEERAV